MNRWVRSVILAAALALGAGGVEAQDIPIAVVGPVTGSNAALGEQMTHGAQMAVARQKARPYHRRRCLRSQAGSGRGERCRRQEGGVCRRTLLLLFVDPG